MKPGIKKRWVAALRSGDYRQARGALKRGKYAHCCLGVLCDIAPKSVGEWRGHTFVSGGVKDAAMLPPGVQAWAGLDADATHGLASKNDLGVSFEQIADYIEANL